MPKDVSNFCYSFLIDVIFTETSYLLALNRYYELDKMISAKGL